MKPKNSKMITGALTSAICTLLGSADTQAEGAGWKIDTAYLSYSEKDRVQADEPTLKIQKTFANDSKINFNLVYDTLSGPSPNGAAPSNQPQTFSGPSGSSSTVIPAGEIPMDSNFKDERKQFGTSWDSLINRLMRYNVGFNVSTEQDYDSMGVSAGLSREFNKKNTTVSTGISFAHDKITPTGGAPEPASPMLVGGAFNTLTGASGTSSINTLTGASGTSQVNTLTGVSGTSLTNKLSDDDDEFLGESFGEDNNLVVNAAEPGEDFEGESEEPQAKTKDVVDFFVGLSQVINIQTIMQFNVGFNYAQGYLNDPYKVVSIVDAVTGVPLTVEEGGIIYESRPDSRFKTSLFWDTKYHLDRGDTVTLSYRFMFDDWGINSHTFDISYRWNMTDQFYVQPHIRLYTQNEADFYRQSLSNAETIPAEVSADARLAAFDATTFGAKMGYKFTPRSEINLRVEKYEQTGQAIDNAIGIQASYDTFPALDASIIQIGYSFEF